MQVHRFTLCTSKLSDYQHRESYACFLTFWDCSHRPGSGCSRPGNKSHAQRNSSTPSVSCVILAPTAGCNSPCTSAPHAFLSLTIPDTEFAGLVDCQHVPSAHELLNTSLLSSWRMLHGRLSSLTLRSKRCASFSIHRIKRSSNYEWPTRPTTAPPTDTVKISCAGKIGCYRRPKKRKEKKKRRDAGWKLCRCCQNRNYVWQPLMRYSGRRHALVSQPPLCRATY